jgi:hypothetical protein
MVINPTIPAGGPMDASDVYSTDTEGLAEVASPREIRLRDGEHLDLRITPGTGGLQS